MALYWFLAWLAGVAGVLQNGLNKKLSKVTGLAVALHVSNLMVLVGGIVVLTILAASSQSEVASALKLKLEIKSWKWWIIIPGLCGLFFITIAPIAIMKLGALKVFVAIVFGQVLASAAWDFWIEKTPVDKWRVIGCALTLLGAYSISLSKA